MSCPNHDQRCYNSFYAEDIILGRKLATGGFGTVFLGDLRKEDGTKVPVVVKKVLIWDQISHCKYQLGPVVVKKVHIDGRPVPDRDFCRAEA
eukprot:1157664-Pelagomonas_calceolata.AAC.4